MVSEISLEMSSSGVMQYVTWTAGSMLFALTMPLFIILIKVKCLELVPRAGLAIVTWFYLDPN